MDILLNGEMILPVWMRILNILVVLISIWFLREVLLYFFSSRITTFTLLLVVFGTNYFQLITGAAPFPQNLLFAFISITLWLTIRWHQNPGWINSVLLGLTLGLTILVNPSDCVILLLPMLWGVYDLESLKAKGQFIRKNLFKALACTDAIVAVLVFLFIFWKPLSAFFGYTGYSDHGVFYMAGIYFPQVMFSWKNGWLVYTPLMILAIAGFYFLAAKNRSIYYSVFLYFIINLLILCSWSTYSHHDEFGRKMFIQSLAVLTIPLGYLLLALSEKKLYLSLPVYLIISFFIVLNLFQTWQYRNNILVPSAMTGNYYLAIFGKTTVSDDDLLRLEGFEPDPNLFLADSARFNNKVLAFYDFEDTLVSFRNALRNTYSKSGKMSFKMDTGTSFSPGIRIRYRELTKQPRVGIRLSGWILSNDTASRIPVCLVITSIHEGNLYRYRTYDLNYNPIRPGAWNHVFLNYITPEDPLPEDELQAYIWYRGNFPIFLDDVRIEMFEPEK